jgi:hypothetical protein
MDEEQPKTLPTWVFVPQPSKWEYRHLPIYEADVETLNGLGEDSWQVLLYLYHSNSLLLTREIPVASVTFDANEEGQE